MEVNKYTSQNPALNKENAKSVETQNLKKGMSTQTPH